MDSLGLAANSRGNVIPPRASVPARRNVLREDDQFKFMESRSHDECRSQACIGRRIGERDEVYRIANEGIKR